MADIPGSIMGALNCLVEQKTRRTHFFAVGSLSYWGTESSCLTCPQGGTLSRIEGNKPIKSSDKILNIFDTSGAVPSVVPLKLGPDQRLPDFLGAFVRCTLVQKPRDLLPCQRDANLERSGEQRFPAGALQPLLRGSVSAQIVPVFLGFLMNSFSANSTGKLIMLWWISVSPAARICVCNAGFSVQAHKMALK